MRTSQLVFVVLLTAQGAFPDVIFSNFSSIPPGYNSSGGGYGPGRTQICFSTGGCLIQTSEFAMGFSVPIGSTFEVTDLKVPLNFSPIFTNGITNVDFTIAAADATGEPGTPLETFTIDGLTTASMVYTVNSVLHPILSSGNYWLEAAIAPGDFGSTVWNFANAANDSGPTAGMAGPFVSGWTLPDTQIQSAFEIDGTAIPEPSFVGVLAGVLGCLALKRTLGRG